MALPPSVTTACCFLLILTIKMLHFQNVLHEVNCSFYLTKAGCFQMLGTVEMENDQTGKVRILFLLFLLLVSLHLYWMTVLDIQSPPKESLNCVKRKYSKGRGTRGKKGAPHPPLSWSKLATQEQKF